MKRVIFVRVHYAGAHRRQPAFFNAMADPQKARAVSAGTQPGERVHLEVQSAMGEVGIDLSAEAAALYRRDGAGRAMADHHGLQGCLPLRAGPQAPRLAT